MIEVKNLTKAFKKPIRGKGLKGMFSSLFSRKFEIKVAVDDVSFTINDGEIVGYIGSNGAGKSTTIKMMTGILTPTKGQVLINGQEPYNPKVRTSVLKNIGVIFGQRTQLWWDLPLVETFSLLKEIYEISNEDFERRFTYLKGVLDLEPFITSPVRTLSLGQRMRADLAAALLHNPAILFLDEPTIGLDVLVKQKLIEAIKSIQKEYNTTIILTTHDMSDIEDLCDRVIILDEGKILYDDTLTNIKHKFGDTRTISVDLKDDCLVEELQEKYPDLHIEKDGLHIDISFDADKMSIGKVMNFVFTHFMVADVKIAESSIERVVTKIYAGREL